MMAVNYKHYSILSFVFLAFAIIFAVMYILDPESIKELGYSIVAFAFAYGFLSLAFRSYIIFSESKSRRL